jgi:glycosyltransferase involved in cell wall biosynthesis
VTRDPWTYQRYLRSSKGEFSVAKQGYVQARSGWFSERSAAYLASGRPVLSQETGFSDWMETGDGVVGFTSPNEAAEGVEEILRRYPEHCRAARAVAEEYFNSKKVLTRLIELVGDSPTA